MNYTQADINYTITLRSTNPNVSLPAQTVTVTRRKATINNASLTFNTKNSNNSGEFTSANNGTGSAYRTKDHITATITGVSNWPSTGIGGRNYLTLSDNATISLSRDNTVVKAITGVTMSFDASYSLFGGTFYAPSSISDPNGVSGSPSNNNSFTNASSTYTWSGSHEATPSVFTMTRGNQDIRLLQFTVDYQYYTWE